MPINHQHIMSIASSPLAQLRAEVMAHFVGVPLQQIEVATALPYLTLIRFNGPTMLTRSILAPSMCLVVQGEKKMLIGETVVDYGPGGYRMSVIEMPVTGQVTSACAEAPYLGIRIDLDPKEVAALIIELAVPFMGKPTTKMGTYIETANAELQEAFVRLLKLLHKPAELPVLSRLLKQEIIYRLLMASGGDVLYHTVMSHYQEKGINEAIQWIKHHYAEPLSIEKLADLVGMGASTLHHRFKALTAMSPLQYQKETRLLEARRLLLTGNLEAATVAFKVGYESPSQFSREYRRLFGTSPLKDMDKLKQDTIFLATE